MALNKHALEISIDYPEHHKQDLLIGWLNNIRY